MLWIMLALIAGILWRWTALRKGSRDPMADAVNKVLVTVAVALVWGLLVWAAKGGAVAAQFFSGYAMEWVLSLDNLIAIAMVFAYFRLPHAYEARILSYGLVSAVIFRLLFTLIGVSMLGLWERGAAVVLGVLVGLTAWKMLKTAGEDNAEMVDHDNRWYVKNLRRWIPITGNTSRPVFFAKQFETEKYYLGTGSDKWTWAATPLLACLVSVEVTDLMFSFDSVPTVIAVSRTPLVIYGAMIFATLGLRQTYFVMQEAQKYLTRLPEAVCGVLMFLALEMIVGKGFLNLDVPPLVTLVVVAAMLGYGVHSSLKEVKSAKLQQKGS